MAEVFLTQPLQIVAGSVAGSKWMSDDLYKRAASTNKLAPFFKSNLDRKKSVVEERAVA
jgi:hypothetical protein